MEDPTHARFRSANQELREFLARIACLANGTGTMSEGELQRVTTRLMNITPEIGDASRGETLNADLQDEIAEYVNNFRALQAAIATIRSKVLAHRSQWTTTKRNVDGQQDWVYAEYLTTH